MKATEIGRKLVKDQPEVPAYRHQLAKNYKRLGDAYKNTGAMAEAETALMNPSFTWIWPSRTTTGGAVTRTLKNGWRRQLGCSTKVKNGPQAGTSAWKSKYSAMRPSG